MNNPKGQHKLKHTVKVARIFTENKINNFYDYTIFVNQVLIANKIMKSQKNIIRDNL